MSENPGSLLCCLKTRKLLRWWQNLGWRGCWWWPKRKTKLKVETERKESKASNRLKLAASQVIYLESQENVFVEECSNIEEKKSTQDDAKKEAGWSLNSLKGEYWSAKTNQTRKRRQRSNGSKGTKNHWILNSTWSIKYVNTVCKDNDEKKRIGWSQSESRWWMVLKRGRFMKIKTTDSTLLSLHTRMTEHYGMWNTDQNDWLALAWWIRDPFHWFDSSLDCSSHMNNKIDKSLTCLQLPSSKGVNGWTQKSDAV